MRLQRLIIVALLYLLAAGSLSFSLGYAWYWRSEAYRDSCAAALSDVLELPADIGGVEPVSTAAHLFHDVTVWLPGRRGIALQCEQAEVISAPTPDDPDAYRIALQGGGCEISNRTWLREDYRTILEQGLRPGFAPSGPRRVDFRDMDVVLQRDDFRIVLGDAAGAVTFPSRVRGRVAVQCRRLNGPATEVPVLLDGVFSPTLTGIRVDELTLTAENVALRQLNLAQVLPANPKAGTFSGELGYAEQAGHKRLSVRGAGRRFDLSELTSALPTGPITGRLPELELEQLVLEDRVPTRLVFRGLARDVSLGDLLAAAGVAAETGRLSLNIGAADLSQEGVERLVLSGVISDVDLERLTSALGYGRMSGTLTARIEDLTIVDNQLTSLDAVVTVTPSSTRVTNWIETRLLRTLTEGLLPQSLAWVLHGDRRLEYVRLHVRLEVRDELLRIYGAEGPGDGFLITLRVFGQEFGLPELPGTIDLRPHLDLLREALRQRLAPSYRYRPLNRWPPPADVLGPPRSPDSPD